MLLLQGDTNVFGKGFTCEAALAAAFDEYCKKQRIEVQPPDLRTKKSESPRRSRTHPHPHDTEGAPGALALRSITAVRR